VIDRLASSTQNCRTVVAGKPEDGETRLGNGLILPSFDVPRWSWISIKPRLSRWTQQRAGMAEHPPRERIWSSAASLKGTSTDRHPRAEHDSQALGPHIACPGTQAVFLVVPPSSFIERSKRRHHKFHPPIRTRRRKFAVSLNTQLSTWRPNANQTTNGMKKSSTSRRQPVLGGTEFAGLLWRRVCQEVRSCLLSASSSKLKQRKRWPDSRWPAGSRMNPSPGCKLPE